MTDERLARRLLETLYPTEETFLRRCSFSWSAEFVDAGQYRPPYRTSVVAEASTLREVAAELLALCNAEGTVIPPDCRDAFLEEPQSVDAVDPVGERVTE